LGGAKDGLNRFDGHSFTSFERAPFDTVGLSDNKVTSLFADGEGYLWIGTARGLDVMRPGLKPSSPASADRLFGTSVAGKYITSVMRDKRGTLWIGTPEGLVRFDPETRKSELYKHVEGNPSSLSHDVVTCIFETGRGTV